mmetsp:Transcript_150399/g.483354  ORF Transcript_150399/g.483354 Transcript_150399/m.483354 type:complete len:290 (+) Transcript_150399:494-1363(+)
MWDRQPLGASSLQVPIPLLQANGGAVALYSEHQATQDHVVYHHCKHEGCVVMLFGIRQVEETVGDRDKSALPHAGPLLLLLLLLLRARKRGANEAGEVADVLAALCEHRLDNAVLVDHEIAGLLHEPEDGSAIEVRQDATLGILLRLRAGVLQSLLRVRSRLLGGCLLILDGGCLLILATLFFLRFLLQLYGVLAQVGLHFVHVCARLRSQSRNRPADLWPIQRKSVIQLTANNLHQLSSSGCIDTLKPQVVVCGEARGIQGLPHGDEHLRREEDMPVVLRQPLQEQTR